MRSALLYRTPLLFTSCNLHYTTVHAVLKETLRIFPLVGRTSRDDTRIHVLTCPENLENLPNFFDRFADAFRALYPFTKNRLRSGMPLIGVVHVKAQGTSMHVQVWLTLDNREEGDVGP